MGWPEAFATVGVVVGVAWAVAYVLTHTNITFK